MLEFFVSVVLCSYSLARRERNPYTSSLLLAKLHEKASVVDCCLLQYIAAGHDKRDSGDISGNVNVLVLQNGNRPFLPLLLYCKNDIYNNNNDNNTDYYYHSSSFDYYYITIIFIINIFIIITISIILSGVLNWYYRVGIFGNRCGLYHILGWKIS